MQTLQTLWATGANQVKQQQFMVMLITIIGRKKILPHCKV